MDHFQGGGEKFDFQFPEIRSQQFAVGMSRNALRGFNPQMFRLQIFHLRHADMLPFDHPG